MQAVNRLWADVRIYVQALSFLAALLCFFTVASPQTQAAFLTEPQIQQVVTLLNSFNVDQQTIQSVTSLLRGATAASSSPVAAQTVDVFLVAGQSNALGAGTASQSPLPQPGTVLQYYKGSITYAVDPVGGALTGSAWPSFGVEYYNRIGHTIAFVPAAVSGSSQAAAADPGPGAGNWDVSGTNFTNSVSQLDAAMAAFTKQGLTPVFKGVLWHQGETDAIMINNNRHTASAYKSALISMISRYRARYGASMPFYIFETGTQGGVPNRGYFQVRDAQAEVAALDPYTDVVFEDAVNFPARGFMQADALHYAQAGYNEMGQIGAKNVVQPGSASAPALAAPGSGWTQAGQGDFNGDGILDTIWRASDGNPVIWFAKPGDKYAFSSIVTIYNPGNDWRITRLADFNGDGKTDLLFQNPAVGSGAPSIWLIDSETLSDGGYVNADTRGTPVTDLSGWTIGDVGDKNGDGKADITWIKNSTGGRAVWYMNGRTIAGVGQP